MDKLEKVDAECANNELDDEDRIKEISSLSEESEFETYFWFEGSSLFIIFEF